MRDLSRSSPRFTGLPEFRNLPFKWVLAVLLAIRLITPAGFMPNAMASGSPFALCSGDAQSAQLLAVLPHGHHNHHHHSDVHRAFDHPCDFAALAFTTIPVQKSELPVFTLVRLVVVSRFGQINTYKDPDLLPPTRAPPAANN